MLLRKLKNSPRYSSIIAYPALLSAFPDMHALPILFLVADAVSVQQYLKAEEFPLPAVCNGLTLHTIRWMPRVRAAQLRFYAGYKYCMFLQWKVGQRVFALTEGSMPWRKDGTYAGYYAAKEDHLATPAASMTFEEAGATPLAALTAYQVGHPN